jgi:glycosyltransferase involved in cell wall biosynthesis
MYKYKFTVFTPTYNRENTLARCYESLLSQTFKDFEWLIVDDGSTDNTESLVKKFADGAKFPIRYCKQRNSGKHIAVNKGAELANGEFFCDLDSDDMLVPDGLKILYDSYCSIPDQLKSDFGVVLGLVCDFEGNIICREFPKDIIDGNYIDIGFEYKIEGDKGFFIKTDILKQYPFPAFGNEKFLAESIVWNKIVLKYKTRCVNRIITKKEYRKNGLSSNSIKNRVLNPIGALNNYKDILNMPAAKPLMFMIRNSINYCRFVLHAHQTSEIFTDLDKKNRLITILCFPIGMMYYLGDKLMIAKK